MKDEKMKPFVFVRPKTTKGKITAVLFLIIILISSVPFINLVNKHVLVLGLPLLML